jgi:hypothetical protein
MQVAHSEGHGNLSGTSLFYPGVLSLMSQEMCSWGTSWNIESEVAGDTERWEQKG